MKSFIFGFLLATLLAGIGYWFIARNHGGLSPASVGQESGQRYYCPMHPTYISDKPGDCPICGMRLVPLEISRLEEKHAGSDHAGQTVPEAGGQEAQKREHAGHQPVVAKAEPPEPGGSVPGYVPVRVDPKRQQMIGVTLEEARVMELEQNIRTVGRVTYDETRLHHVHTKFEGFIEEIFVDYVGKFVKKGEPLFSVYSPELVATQKEYLLALRAQKQFGLSGSTPALGGVDLLGAARQRLALWDVGPEEIARLERTGQPSKAVTIRSSVSGFVTAKTALQGMRVMPGDALYDVADLSTVWLLADVYEVNLPFVRVGQPARVTLSYLPGRVWKGRVNYLYPTLDEKTRTAKVRLEFANPAGLLKPEMYADVELEGRRGTGVAVPESAVISTGERHIVFVAKGEGLFEPREVSTGVKVRNYYEILSGVAAGEQVVTGANFLLDSESKLKASVAGMVGAHQHGQ